MERQKSVIKYKLRRILIFAFCFTLLFCSFVLPVGAVNQVIDYDDIVSNVSSSDGYDTVFLRWPIVGTFSAGSYGESQGEMNMTLSFTPADFYYFPFRAGSDGIRLSKNDIPDDAVFTMYFSCETYNVPTKFWIYLQQFDKDGELISSVAQGVDFLYSEESKIVQLWNAKPLNFVDGCDSFVIVYNWRANGVPLTVNGTTSYMYNYTNPVFDVSFKLSSAYRQQQQTNKTNNILKAVENQLADQGKTLDDILGTQQETNNKLDGLWGSITDGFSSMGDKLNDLFTGGSAGADLSGAADDMSDQIGSVEDFQSGIESDLEAGFDEVLDFSGLASLAPAFAFIGTYVNKIWYDMDHLQVVFILVFGIGTFLQLAQHVPRMPVLRSQNRSDPDRTHNSNWYDPVSGSVVDASRDRGRSRAGRSS